MSMTAQFCRDQERVQLDRAAISSLANIRLVARRAAAAWAGEAHLAEAREARQQKAADGRVLSRNLGEDEISENPDLGCAGA